MIGSLVSFRPSRPSLVKAVRFGFAAALTANVAVLATVAYASIADNGTYVGTNCWAAYNPNIGNIAACIVADCQTGDRTPDQQTTCNSLASTQAGLLMYQQMPSS